MIVLKLFLLFASLAALLITFKTNSRCTNLIVGGMLASIVLVQFSETFEIGLIVYLVFVLLSLVYGIFVKGKSFTARIIIIMLAALVFTYWLWLMNHWHGNTALLPTLALAVGIWGFSRRNKVKKEWGFLIILWVDALDSAIENLIKFL